MKKRKKRNNKKNIVENINMKNILKNHLHEIEKKTEHICGILTK